MNLFSATEFGSMKTSPAMTRLLDLLTIVLQPRLQHPQLFGACHGKTISEA
jgi:hypothetical protein